MVLEGIDIQCISFVAPTIVEDWGIDMGTFGIVFTSGLVGAVLGAAVFGPMGAYTSECCHPNHGMVAT